MTAVIMSVEAALEAKLLAANIGIDIQWPNEVYDPALQTPWCRVSHIKVQPTVESMGPMGTSRYSGQFQVSLFYPLGVGRGLCSTKADAIVAAFKPGTVLDPGGANVVVSSSGSRTPVPDSSWFHVPVLINWWTILQP